MEHYFYTFLYMSHEIQSSGIRGDRLSISVIFNGIWPLR